MSKAGKLKTYDPKKVLIAMGSHAFSGYADDSYVSVEPSGDGTTKKTGCDGEIVRSMSPDHSFVVKVTLLQTSDSNSYFQNLYNRDQETGDAIEPIMVHDLMGGLLFSADQAWVPKPANRVRGKEATNNEWEIHTGIGEITE